MKKLFIFFICVVLSLSSSLIFTGCDKAAKIKAIGITESEYNAGEKIIEITDKYLDFKISKEEATTQLNEIEGRISGSVASFCRLISWEISYPNKTDTDVLEDRNKLAEVLGLPQR